MVEKLSTIYSRGSGIFTALKAVEQTSGGFSKNMSLSGMILLSNDSIAKLLASSRVKSPVTKIMMYLILVLSWQKLVAD